jgi:hypothetical protein
MISSKLLAECQALLFKVTVVKVTNYEAFRFRVITEESLQ